MDTRTRNVLSICSGTGGLELGVHAALDGRSRTVCYVENELSVASILAARMEDGSLDSAVVWSDLRTFDPAPWRGKVDILAGGFPCQPHSVAGSQLGEDDPRELSGEVLRIADGLGLPILFLENVPGILRFYWDSIRPQLREMGYQIAEGLFTASETGAPHKRERLFILAHADIGSSIQCELQKGSGHDLRDSSELADTGQQHQQLQRRGLRPESQGEGNELADTEGDIRRTSGDDRRVTSDGAGDQELADTEGIISERSIRGRNTERQSKTAIRDRGSELAELPLFPPGPNDHAGWQWLLARWPELSPTYCKEGHDVQPEVPTTECEFCGSPDGPTQELPTDALLRGIGNGVIPIVAATAYRELTKQLEDEFSRNA